MFLQKTALLSSGNTSFWEQFLSWYHQSTFYELLVYFEERYFSVDFHVYEHITLGPNAGKTAQMMILGIAIGLIIASIMIAYTRTKLGGFVRKLIKTECLSPDRAKTLSELGEFRNAALRRELLRGVTLRKFVCCADTQNAELESSMRQESEKSTLKEKKPIALLRIKEFFLGKSEGQRIDFTVSRFYIPEDLKYRADTRFEKKGSGWLFALLTSVGVIVFASLICKFLPDILQLMDNLIGMMAP